MIIYPPGATHTVERIACFNKRDRSLCYWQSRNTETTVHCETAKQAESMIARLIAEGRAVPQTVYAG